MKNFQGDHQKTIQHIMTVTIPMHTSLLLIKVLFSIRINIFFAEESTVGALSCVHHINMTVFFCLEVKTICNIIFCIITQVLHLQSSIWDASHDVITYTQTVLTLGYNPCTHSVQKEQRLCLNSMHSWQEAHPTDFYLDNETCI